MAIEMKLAGPTQLFGGKIYTTIEGDAIVEPGHPSDIYGLVTGNLIAKPNSVVQLHGLVMGDVIAERGSTVTISGMVQKKVILTGGHVEVSGIIRSWKEISGNLKTLPGAIVGPKD